MKRYIIVLLLALALVPTIVLAGPHVHTGDAWYDTKSPDEHYSRKGVGSQVAECGCTVIQIAIASSPSEYNKGINTTLVALCEGGTGGSGGGGNSGPPSLSSVTVDEYEEMMRRLLGDVTVKIEDLEGQVGQAVLDALNQV